jgi:hypothetical protein
MGCWSCWADKPISHLSRRDFCQLGARLPFSSKRRLPIFDPKKYKATLKIRTVKEK